ncbi:peptidase S8 [Sulfurifustis variabilis]|uniref:Peptidase S8 n=1 Tax=Sulfurifustis variabilis TaxID=1675686 RepID=A0A1C7AFF8_9GAMM|nr:S8 family serine peptidase [Sulfurifustis variabilis]BAU50048.1 peptidase S8 [Sulfurifustis variabilis]
MREPRTITLRALVLGLACLVCAPVVQAGKLDPGLVGALGKLGPGETVDVIIRCGGKVDARQFRDRDTKVRRQKLIRALRTRAEACESSLRAELRDGPGRPRQLWTINGVAATLPAAAVERLARLPGVERITLDAAVAAPAGAAGGSSAPQWNVQAIRAPELWEHGHDGTGVVVAALDTGVDLDHPDIGPKWRGGTNGWFDPNGEHATPYDASGHGTHTMGLIVGGDAGGSVIGVAPGARWIAAKIFDDGGQSQLSRIHLGLQWALDPDGDPESDDAADIVNNSWYLQNTVNVCDTEFADDIAALRASEIAVVFASGNTGPGPATSVSASNNPGAAAVGAVDASWTVGGFSGRGPSACDGATYPRLVAPGAGVRTADLTLGGLFPDSYVEVTGTSFSAAHVTGGLAVLKGAMAARGIPATVSLLESAVEETAVDLGAPGADNDYGAGLLDLKAAYDWLVSNAGSPAPGQLRFGAAEYSAGEGGGSVTVTVVRAGGSAGEVTVDYATADGTATAGADYVAASGTLIFGDGETTRSFVVTLLDDGAHEGDETLNVTLGRPTGGATLGSPAGAVLTVLEDDPAVIDADADGYASTVDCNDGDAAIHPGAQEIKHDGVDQDCNGHDLTIEILTARYDGGTDTLLVEATSAHGRRAYLVLEGHTWMRWNQSRGLFFLTRTRVGGDPGSVTVSGFEGSETAPTRGP